ncbi:MAG: DUF1648 domain-containing protein [Peptoniphilaceae bacterium]
MSEKMIMLLYSIFILLILMIVQLLIPNITRKNIFLGVKIPEDRFKTDEVKKIIKGYRVETIIVGAVLLIVSSVISYKFGNEILFGISILIYIVTLFLVYLRWNKKAKKLKKEMNWDKLGTNTVIIDTNFSKGIENEKVFSKKWMVIPLMIILINIFLSIYMYPSLPDKIPINWDFTGNISGWMNKSIWGALLMPLTQLFIATIMYFVYYVIRNSKKQIEPGNPEISIKKNIKFVKVWGIYLLVSTIILQLIFTYNNMAILGIVENMKIFTVITLVLSSLMIIGAIVIGVKVGQGGERLKLYGKEETSSRYDINDDKYWKLGNSIYYNKKDPSIFIEKRVGIGWTVNAGTTIGLMFLIVPIVIMILVFVLYL